MDLFINTLRGCFGIMFDDRPSRRRVVSGITLQTASRRHSFIQTEKEKDSLVLGLNATP